MAGAGLLAKIVTRILGIGTKKPEETIVGSVIDRLVPDKNKQKEIMLEMEREYKKHKQDLIYM